MKRTLLIISIIAVLLIFVLWAKRKTDAAQSMQYDFDSIDFGIDNVRDVIDLINNGKDGSITLRLSNYSKESFTVDNLYLEIYDNTGQKLLAYQTQPLSEALGIKPQSVTTVEIPMFWKGLFFRQVLKDAGFNNLNDLWQVITDYYNTGKLGVTLQIKGYAMIKGFKVNFQFPKNV